MAIVSRLKLDHPALGTAGGSALHTSIESIYTKIGDMTNARFFTQAALGDGASVDFDHNFNVNAFDDLRYDLYLWNSGTGEITEVTDLTGWTIVATPSFEKLKIRVTNGTGSSKDIALVVLNDPININELVDVDTTGAEEGQTLVYDAINKIWIPGASGDSSFKFQKIVGTTLTVKNGYLILEDGRELYAATDLSVDLSALGDGDYYGYVDLFGLPLSSLVNGRELIAVTASNFVFSTTVPRLMNTVRYAPIGYARKAGGVWTIVASLAYRRHETPLGANNSVEYVLSSIVIGNTGDVAQVRAGHVLAQGSFPSAAFANTSFYNLSSVSTVNDGNTTLAHNLTNNGTTLFDQVGIMGVDDQCPGLNGTTQYLSSTDAHFDPGDTDFTCGGWFNPTTWNEAVTRVLFSQFNSTDNKRSFMLRHTVGGLQLYASIDGSVAVSSSYDSTLLTGWHHLLLKYAATLNKLSLYLDGFLILEIQLSSGLYPAGNTYRKFNVGCYNNGTDFYSGLIDEFFFCNGTAFTDDEISKIYSAKISHNRSLAPNQQDWSIDATYAGITRRIENDVIVDKDLNDLYLDCSSLPTSGCTIEAILQARGAIGNAMAANSRMFEGTAADLDILIGSGVSFGFPSMITSASLFVESPVSNSFDPVSDTSPYVRFESISPYRVIPAPAGEGGTTFTAAFGGTTKVKLVVSTGNLSVAVKQYIWNSLVVTSSRALLTNDEILANPTGTLNFTLPSAPRVGDRVRVLDYDYTWSATDKVIVLRNGMKINNVSDDLQLADAGNNVELVFNGVDNWVIV